MKTRTALTIGALGTAGAIGTYLFNRPKLRKEMMEAPTAQEAASAFAAQLEKDAAEIAETVKDKAMHNWLMDEVRSSGQAINDKLTGAAKHVKSDIKAVKKEAKNTMKDMKEEKDHIQKTLKDTAHKAAATSSQKAAA